MLSNSAPNNTSKNCFSYFKKYFNKYFNKVVESNGHETDDSENELDRFNDVDKKDEELEYLANVLSRKFKIARICLCLVAFIFFVQRLFFTFGSENYTTFTRVTSIFLVFTSNIGALVVVTQTRSTFFV
eukprot:c10844_g1_i1.p1 GENE.c10844_g1_i1~~c10844_g1_i1.p1  ORF type:complete len:129 (-),score=27.34 c10844_g1_i1:44-430(-)